MIAPDEIEALNRRFEAQPTEEILGWAWERFGSRAAIGTSFQGGGLVLMDLARKQGLGFPFFTIDTGLLFPETVALRGRLEAFLGRSIEVLEPQQTVEAQAAVHGDELWRRDPDFCCTLRKVLPLRNRLEDLDAWITGLRREQSTTRSGIGVVELYRFDESSGRDVVKLNPLAGWKRDEVWDYLRRHAVPYNPLHDRGFRSIGCRPCTMEAGTSESERAGRWTGFSKTECGIHTFLKRTVE